MGLIEKNILGNFGLDGPAGGLKHAIGSVTAGSVETFFYPDGGSASFNTIEVTTLDFEPQYILVYGDGTAAFSVLFPDDFYSASADGRIITSTYSINSSSGTPHHLELTSPAYVNDTGFKLPIVTSGTYNYIAFQGVE